MGKAPGPHMKPLSAERGNLSGLHSFKHSGLANRDALNVSTKKTGAKETIVMTTTHRPGKVAPPRASPARNWLEEELGEGEGQARQGTIGWILPPRLGRACEDEVRQD